ncbi:MAG: hypothetical protein IT292_01775 [Deltaproteobacteria bacterium]|nr:hypothetical protein [Deltaproteobacteria bacterium]
MVRHIKIIFIVLLILCHVACTKQEILSNLEDKQTISLMLAFEKAGVRAYKEKYFQGRQEKYRLLVESPDYSRALKILQSVRLPDNNLEQWSLLLKQSHFASDSPEMIAVKKDLATALQLEKLLSALPAVLDARVYVRQGLTNTPGFDPEKPKRSVIVVLRFQSKPTEQVATYQSVKQIVLKAIPDLVENELTVIFNDAALEAKEIFIPASETEILYPFRFRVTQADTVLAKKQVFGFGIIVFLVGGVVGAFLTVFSKNLRWPDRQPRLPLVGAENLPLSIEAKPNSAVSRKPTVLIMKDR